MSWDRLHRLRNALAATLGQVEGVRRDDPADVERCLARIRARVTEASDLVAQLEGGLRDEQGAYPPTLPERASDIPTVQPPDDEEDTSEIIDGTYRLVSLVGRGGMGTVSLAWDDRLRRDVALKHLDHEVWANADAREAFAREARAMAQVHHPNVVTIYALGEHEGKPYIAMEFVSGTTLGELIERGPVTLDEALGIVDQVCCGISAIHRAGVVHRDIKPSNILIGEAFRVAVTDFGLVHEVDGSPPLLRGGTPGYLAPESLGQTAIPGAAADIYAVGLITHELLTGCPVFDGDSVEEVVTAQLTGEVPRLANRRGDLPEALDVVIAKATALDPAQRQGSIDELREELFSARQELAESYDATVFVVEDDPDVRASLLQLAANALPGAQTRGFDDGATALEAAKASAPEVAIIDLGLPGLDGFELTTKLQQLSPPVENLVAVTGVGGAADWQRLQRSGASGFLLKPVDATALTALLRKLVPRSALACSLALSRPERAW